MADGECNGINNNDTNEPNETSAEPKRPQRRRLPAPAPRSTPLPPFTPRTDARASAIAKAVLRRTSMLSGKERERRLQAAQRQYASVVNHDAQGAGSVVARATRRAERRALSAKAGKRRPAAS